jgi:hypothetical protein
METFENLEIGADVEVASVSEKSSPDGRTFRCSECVYVAK